MYGSQMWGTECLQAGNEFSSSLSTLHLHFLKGTLGVKRNTGLYFESGHMNQPVLMFLVRSQAVHGSYA